MPFCSGLGSGRNPFKLNKCHPLIPRLLFAYMSLLPLGCRKEGAFRREVAGCASLTPSEFGVGVWV